MLPDKIRLSGMDYFQLLIDHHIKTHGGQCHEARLMIKLEGYIRESEIIDVFRNHKKINQIFRLRINRRYFSGFPEVILLQHDAIPVITSIHFPENEIPNNIEWDNQGTDIFNPIQLKIFYLGDGNTGLLFKFNHILFDYTGIELFIRLMNGEAIELLDPHDDIRVPFITKFKGFFNAIGFAFYKGGRNILTAGNATDSVTSIKLLDHTWEMSDMQLKTMQIQMGRYGVSLHESIYFIAMTSQALYDIIWQGRMKGSKVAIQVPVSSRKRSKKQGILFNHLSLLYYNLYAQHFVDTKLMISELLRSMKMQIKKSLPQAFLHFAHAYRIMPLPVYYAMMKLPTGGRLSSYNISFLGNSFHEMDKFLGHNILDIRNYPSNTISPGITFLYYYFRGKFRMTISFVEHQFSKSEQLMIIDKLKTYLLEGGKS